MAFPHSLHDMLEDLVDDLVTDGAQRLRRVFDAGAEGVATEIKGLTARVDELVTIELLQAPRRRGRTKRLLKLRELERKVESVKASIDEMVEDPEGRPRTGRRGRRPKPPACLVERCSQPQERDGMCSMHLAEYEEARQEFSPRVIRRRKD